jgi:Tol biopolymer transport system component
MKKSVLLIASTTLAVLLACGVALAAVEGSAVGEEKIVFISDRATGEGVDNPQGDDEIFTINPDGTGLQQITKNDTDEDSPAVSPDGTQIVFEGLGLQGNNKGIWRMNFDGSGRRRIGYGSEPDWSPNGRWITYYRRFAQQSDIFKMKSVNGLDKTNLTNTPGVREQSPDWSPTGLRIAYVRGDIYEMRPDGTQRTNLTNTSELWEEFPEYSPNGNLIAFTEWRVGLLKMRADGVGQASVIYGGREIFAPTWSPDGNQIAFTTYVGSGVTSNSDILKVNADGTGLPENITHSSWWDSAPDWYEVPVG